MRRVIASEFVSLGGVMEDPSWTFRLTSEDGEGKGKRLFAEGLDTKDLWLVESKTFDSGAVVLTYRPAGKDSE